MVFSGIVEGTAVVSRVTKETGLYRVEIEASPDFLQVCRLEVACASMESA